MKKILFILFLATTSINAFSQNIDALIASVSKSENAEYTVVDSTMLQVAKATQEADKNEIFEKFNAVEILNLEKCADNIKEKFRSDFKHLDNNEYTPLINVSKSGKKISIIQKKMDTGLISEFVILIGEAPLCIRIKGNFTEKDIDKIIQQQNFN